MVYHRADIVGRISVCQLSVLHVDVRKILSGVRLCNVWINMYSKDIINQLLEILLPQYFDSVINSIKTALWQIDPAWEKGQFEVFSKHFRMNLLRSLFAQKVLLADTKFFPFHEKIILEKILEATKDLNDKEKARFYGKVLSKYILLCPKERFPAWAETYKDRSNLVIIWNLHSTVWLTIYK